MESLFEKIRIVEGAISEEQGSFALFGLFLREDAQEKWDLIVSANWLTGDYFKNLEYITEKLKQQLDASEITQVSRIVLLDPRDRFVINVNNNLSIEHGIAEFTPDQFDDMTSSRAVIVTSKKEITKSNWDEDWISTHRNSAISGLKTLQLTWDEDWISAHRDLATAGLRTIEREAFMEIRLTLTDYTLDATPAELRRQAKPAQIEFFGWPLGIVLERDEFKPKPTTDGIVTEILIPGEADERSSYDYWTLRKDGAFYLLKSIFEDERRQGYIFFNTRIVRITEALLYAARLYSGLNVPRNSRFLVAIRHGGLKGRILSTSSPARRFPPSETNISNVDEVNSEIETSIEEIESNPSDVVEKFTQPLFVVFNFFELRRTILEEIVNKYIVGEVT